MSKEQRKVTLKLVRGAKGKSQKDIAAALSAMGRETSQATVSKIERGEWSPTVELAIDLAKAYEVTIIEMLIALGFDLTGVWGEQAT
jgi:transcriptional regulator with XRE-family HTH domain